MVQRNFIGSQELRIKLVATDYGAQMEQIDRAIEAKLRTGSPS